MGGVEEDDEGTGVRRFGSLGGEDRRTNSAQSLDTEDVLGLTMEYVETFSKEPSRLALSCSRLLSGSRLSRSMG